MCIKKKKGTKIQSEQCITFDPYQPSRRFWYEKQSGY